VDPAPLAKEVLALAAVEQIAGTFKVSAGVRVIGVGVWEGERERERERKRERERERERARAREGWRAREISRVEGRWREARRRQKR
jgi:hypothetical protein